MSIKDSDIVLLMDKRLVNKISDRILSDISGWKGRKDLYSLILYGSVIRCDYIPKVSDIDFFAVVYNEGIVSELKEILTRACRDIDVCEVDLAWEYLENLEDPLFMGYPYKFLTVYQEDFRRHHLVVYGEDIIDMLPKYRWNRIIRWRCGHLLNLAQHYLEKGDNRMMHIVAGETARLIVWIEKKTLNKRHIVATLERMGDQQALQIYQAYLKGREQPYSNQHLYKFIKSRVEKIMETTPWGQI